MEAQAAHREIFQAVQAEPQAVLSTARQACPVSVPDPAQGVAVVPLTARLQRPGTAVMVVLRVAVAVVAVRVSILSLMAATAALVPVAKSGSSSFPQIRLSPQQRRG